MTNLNITLPTCWQELTPKQLRYVFYLIGEGYSPEAVKTYCFFRWSNMEVVEAYGDGYTIRYEFNLHHLTALQVAESLCHLAWLDSVPTVPIRLAVVDGHRAKDADLSGIPFEQYIVCDNLYQGYLHTQNDDLLQQMAAILYECETIRTTKEERISVFYWFAAVKGLFARKFTHLFTTNTKSVSSDMERELLDRMNAQIRALTKGDITKEKEVLAMDVWRALTELDAQAADYEELQKEMRK